MLLWCRAMSLKVLAFAGALRKGSFNRKLIAIAARHAAAMGAEVDLLDLHEVAMPLYDGDVEQEGMPAGSKALRERIAAAQVLLISSPEYNSSIPGTLKNAIDWASRPPTPPFRGKVVGLMAASPGPYGGARMLGDLRKVFAAMGSLVVPTQLALSRAGEVFNERDELRDPNLERAVEGVVRDAIDTARKLSPA
jgi:chromate reductase, NAD(P)H dehydrogenase (quinone)